MGIILPQASECREYRLVPPCPAKVNIYKWYLKHSEILLIINSSVPLISLYIKLFWKCIDLLQLSKGVLCPLVDNQNSVSLELVSYHGAGASEM